MSRVVRFDRVGDPDVLHICDVTLDEPRAGEVLVDVLSIGVNRAEVAFRRGEYIVDPQVPCGLGVEGCGRIVALGDGVDGFEIGQRVSVLPSFPQGGRYAMYASQAIVPAHSLVPAPEGLSDIDASAIWMPAMTAYGALVELGRITSDDFVLITAASSGVGLAAIQIVRAVGATPIATTRTAAKFDALLAAGAAHVIVTERDDLTSEIARITDGRGVRIAFDPVAGPFAESLIPSMADEGIIFFYGGLSDQPTFFDRRPIIRKGISFTGYTVAQVLKKPDRRARAYDFIIANLKNGTLSPTVDKVFSLDEVVEAHRYVESNAQIGKVVMTLPSSTQ